MRKVLVLTLSGLFLISAIVFAQGMEGMKGDMMGKGKDMGMNPMGGMMMKAMMKKTIVATEDGGVIVLAGNKLMKYDKNLNLVKEVEIKIDMEAMQKNMKEMMKNCPMMKGGMTGRGRNNPAENALTAGEIGK